MPHVLNVAETHRQLLGDIRQLAGHLRQMRRAVDLPAAS